MTNPSTFADRGALDCATRADYRARASERWHNEPGTSMTGGRLGYRSNVREFSVVAIAVGVFLLQLVRHP
jgi:hypothetical protein